MTELLSPEWTAAVVEASAPRSGGRDGVVAITIGKTKRAVLHIDRGRARPAADGAEPDVTVPTTAAQLASLIDGSESLAQAFMRGDIKPVGATGALLAVVELFEDVSFRARLAALV